MIVASSQMHCLAVAGAGSPNWPFEHDKVLVLVWLSVVKFCIALSVVITLPVLSKRRP